MSFCPEILVKVEPTARVFKNTDLYISLLEKNFQLVLSKIAESKRLPFLSKHLHIILVLMYPMLGILYLGIFVQEFTQKFEEGNVFCQKTKTHPILI